MAFSKITIGAAFTYGGIEYRKVSTITAESAFSVCIFDGGELVAL